MNRIKNEKFRAQYITVSSLIFNSIYYYYYYYHHYYHHHLLAGASLNTLYMTIFVV